MHATEDGHEQSVACMLPAKIVGIGATEHEGQQRAGVAKHGCHYHERGEFQPERVVSEAQNALFVVAQCLKRAAERSMCDAP